MNNLYNNKLQKESLMLVFLGLCGSLVTIYMEETYSYVSAFYYLLFNTMTTYFLSESIQNLDRQQRLLTYTMYVATNILSMSIVGICKVMLR